MKSLLFKFLLNRPQNAGERVYSGYGKDLIGSAAIIFRDDTCSRLDS